jgi:uncharacterized repeat protein (TIGR01451 family)
MGVVSWHRLPRQIFRCLALSLALLCWSLPVAAQELLLNRSFENPVTPANGNNFYTTIPNWTVINIVPATQTTPWNVIRPFSGYAGNPTVTPTGGGIQYLDINSAAGTIRQTITIPSNGMIDFSGWYSVRDFAQALTGLNINIRTPGGALVGTISTSFAASDPIGTWRQATRSNLPITAGTYIFEAEMPDFANFDLASLVFKPGLTTTKTSAPFSDPLRGTVNPLLIPGAVAEYTISVANPGSYTVTTNSVLVSDPTPIGVDLVVTDIGGAGSGPALFTASTSGLAYTFTSLASMTDDIEFSNNSGVSWSYVPVANPDGVDPAVTTVRIRPRNAMAANSNFSLRLRYRIR